MSDLMPPPFQRMANTNFEQIFNNIDNILRNEAGCGTELDYIEQTSWILFLKYLDDLETDREAEALLRGENYTRLIEPRFRWTEWAAPKDGHGEYYHTAAMTGDDLADFVNQQLFPYLKRFQEKADSADTLEYKIGEIFSELRNKITSGYNLREILQLVDGLKFQTSQEKHEMSHLYESKIQRMGNAGRNGGEYYTPRPLIRTIVKVIDPKIGETIYDPACGSAGFLCEAFKYLEQKVESTLDMETLQNGTFVGKEKKGLAYIIATMNMIFHGVSAPNIFRTNTLAENLASIEQKDRKDIILANPPFGGSERKEVLQNFPISTSETAYLFMQHFIKMLKAGGRAGVVIKNTFLSNSDNASIALRQMLLEECDLHTVLDLPSGVFTGAGVKTVVLFFEKGRPTDRIWYYQFTPSRTLGKTTPLTEADLNDFLSLQATKEDSENSWTVDVNDLNESYDLSVKNPNKVEVVDNRTPRQIAEEIWVLNEENMKLLDEIMEVEELFQATLKEVMTPKEGWVFRKLGEICISINGLWKGKKEPFVNVGVIRNANFTKDFTLDFTKIEYLDVEARQYTTRKLQKGDIIVEKSGGSDKQPVGRAIIFDEEEGEYSFSNFTSVLRIKDKEKFSYKFLYLYLLHIYMRGDTKGMQKATTGIHNLDYHRFLDINIPVIPLAEQHQIVSFIETESYRIGTIKTNAERIIQECQNLKQSLLKQVFEKP